MYFYIYEYIYTYIYIYIWCVCVRPAARATIEVSVGQMATATAAPSWEVFRRAMLMLNLSVMPHSMIDCSPAGYEPQRRPPSAGYEALLFQGVGFRGYCQRQDFAQVPHYSSTQSSAFWVSDFGCNLLGLKVEGVKPCLRRFRGRRHQGFPPQVPMGSNLTPHRS